MHTLFVSPFLSLPPSPTHSLSLTPTPTASCAAPSASCSISSHVSHPHLDSSKCRASRSPHVTEIPHAPPLVRRPPISRTPRPSLTHPSCIHTVPPPSSFTISANIIKCRHPWPWPLPPAGLAPEPSRPCVPIAKASASS
jgi:hypothetical protein